jgi:hypothetical protein
VHDQLRGDEYGESDQKPDMQLNVVEKAQLSAAADQVAFQGRQQGERQPGEEREHQYPAGKEFERRAGEMSPPEHLKEGATQNQ